MESIIKNVEKIVTKVFKTKNSVQRRYTYGTAVTKK